jgi:mRNA interferase MazF
VASCLARELTEPPTVTVLPLVSSQLVPAIARVDIAASDANGLRAASQIVVHRPQTISRAKVSRVIGRANGETMPTLTRALAVFLGLA